MTDDFGNGFRDTLAGGNNGDARHYKIKPPRPQDERLLDMLRQPHVANKVEALAKTLNEMYNKSAKVLMDIRPGARFRAIETGQEYIYEAAITPYAHSDFARLVMQQAHRPVEELTDRGYFIFRTVVAGSKTDIVLTEDAGERHVMAGVDFVSYFAIGVFELMDLANNDEKTLIEKTWRPQPRKG